jgi:hypothetical protein
MLYSSGCQVDESSTPATGEMTSTLVAQRDTDTPTTTPSEIATLESTPVFNKIAEARPREIWWSLDSKKMYYKVSGGDIFEYDILNNETTPIDNDVYHPETPQPGLLQQLPVNAKDVGQSPSRKLALYVIPVGPTPTPPSTSLVNREVPAQLWMWQDGKSELVGEIMDCIYSYAWSTNEEIVIAYSFPEPWCDNSVATLVDLNVMSITSLFPGIKWAQLSCCDPSPDGSQLLYHTDNELYLLNTETFNKNIIAAPPLKYLTAYWIDAQRLLVLYPDIRFEPLIIGILDLNTNSVDELFSESDSIFEGEKPVLYSVSPDGHWLAFATGEMLELLNAVWIVRLPDR